MWTKACVHCLVLLRLCVCVVYVLPNLFFAVLGFFVSELAKFHNARHGTQLNMQSFDNYDFSQVLH